MVKQFIKERIGTIILLVIVAAMLLSGFFSIKKARQNAITYTEDYEAPEGNAKLTGKGSYASIAKTDSLELFYNDVKGSIKIKDLKSGNEWKSICDEEVYDMSSVNGQWSAYLQSPVTVSYNDLKKRDSGVKKIFANKDCTYLESEPIDGGIAVTYGFLKQGLFLTVEYKLDDDQLVVRVPWDKIREESKYAITIVELLPFLGAQDNSIDGYLFYPDGSGAISSYELSDTRPSNVKSSTYYTYTNRHVNFANLLESENYDRYTAALPVFGIKNGDKAMFATFTEGAENTAVVAYPSGYVVDLNHIGFEIYTRNVFNVDMYSISTGRDSNVTGGSVQRVDKNLIQRDREARYFFLSGDQANYGGMANVYRNYLIESGQLSDAMTGNEQMSLSLALLMGTEKDGMVFKEPVTMTTFEQTEDILKELNSMGVDNTQVVLKGWIKGYADYANWGIANGLGGKGGLKDLNKYAEENTNNKLYLANQFTIASSETKGVTENKDVAYDGLGVEMSRESFSGTEYYMLSADASVRFNEKFLKRIDKYDSIGVAYENLGKIVFGDYNENHPFTKAEAVEKLQSILVSAKNAGHSVAVDGANQYVYKDAGFIYDMKEDSFGLNVTDYAVPFVQMVISGMIPYSTEGAGNLSYDLDIQKLKWIEYGSLPYFYLTAESALNLVDTDYDDLFSSTFDDWKQTVADTYSEFKTNFSDVYGHQMVDHKILLKDVAKVTYDNGISIYVNYTKDSVKVEGQTIEPKSYLIVKGGN